MSFKLLLLGFLIKIVVTIRLEVNIDENRNVEVTHEGIETSIVTDEDIDLFNIREENLKRAVELYFGKRPADVFVRSPTPWNDLYKSYDWEPVKRVLSVISAKVTNMKTVPVVVMSQDAENPSNVTITVETGLSHEVKNTLKTTLSKENEFVVSQDIEYGINVGFANAGGKTGLSFTTTLGKSEEKTKTETIGTTSNMKVELKPGAAIRAALTASVGYIEIEVVHSASLTGNVALNYNPPYRGHHFHRLSIQDINNFGGIKTEITTTQTIKMECYGEVKLKVSDLKTVDEVHMNTVDNFHEKTIDKVHNKTLEKVHKKTVDKTALKGLLPNFDYMNMIVKLFCISCKNCLALCDADDNFGNLLR